MDACTLLEVEPAALVVAAPFDDATSLPRGSLVRAGAPCDAGGVPGRKADVLSIPRWYADAVRTPAIGASACVPEGVLAPPPPTFLVERDAAVLRDAGLKPGDVTAVTGACDAWKVGKARLDRDALAALRPVPEDVLASARTVQAAYAERFGPISLADVPIADEGFVGVPFPRALDADALAAEYVREALDTEERRQKADRWYGGDVAGRPAYAHFSGTDAPWSDVWGTAETVVTVLDLARKWADYCPTVTGASGAAACLLQIGDLAWFDGVRPDPLGHKDHWTGRCVDVRLFRADGSRYEAWWNRPDDRPGRSDPGDGYDRALTTAFLSWVTSTYDVETAFFDDPAVIAAVPGVRAQKGHDDHVHLCF